MHHTTRSHPPRRKKYFSKPPKNVTNVTARHGTARHGIMGGKAEQKSTEFWFLFFTPTKN